MDDFRGPGSPLRFAVNAVAGDPRLVGDDGAASAGQTIEERRLAHVGAAHNDERWDQIVHKFLVGHTMSATACCAIFQCSAFCFALVGALWSRPEKLQQGRNKFCTS